MRPELFVCSVVPPETGIRICLSTTFGHGHTGTQVNVTGGREPQGQALYTRDVDRDAVQRARYTLLCVAVLTVVFIVGTLIGMSYCVCLVVYYVFLLMIFYWAHASAIQASDGTAFTY